MLSGQARRKPHRRGRLTSPFSALYRRVDWAAGLKGTDRAPVQAPFMSLGEGNQAHDHQSRQDKSGYEVLHHGYHSTGLAHYVSRRPSRPKMMNTAGAAVNGLQDRFEPGRPEAARRNMPPSRSSGMRTKADVRHLWRSRPSREMQSPRR